MQTDLFFITYDEPQADERWEKIYALFPRSKRIHGVKGFDAAYKACARQARSERFYTIDGDNELLPAFQALDFNPPTPIEKSDVFSWPAKNIINGLCYGNGGIKNWHRDTVLSMQTHEVANENKHSTDFCYQLKYHSMSQPLSIAIINDTPLQAFRSGFREGVKMCLENGVAPQINKNYLAASLKNHIWNDNLQRLRIWCSVGADEKFGLWAMLGARMGVKNICIDQIKPESINDYDWFESLWNNEILPQFFSHNNECEKSITEGLIQLEQLLNKELDLKILTLSKNDSKFFKTFSHGV